MAVSASDLNSSIRVGVAEAFRAESGGRRRDPHQLSVSALSGCTRRAAYVVAGAEVSDEPELEEARAANLGTWIHAGLLPRLAEALGDGVTEHPVTLHAGGLHITGTVDLYLARLSAVSDLKTVGEWRLQEVIRSGAYPAHTMQVAGYALALLQEGRRVDWLVLVYLDRGSGLVEMVAERFGNRHLLLILNRVREIEGAAEEPDGAPRATADGSHLLGPGLSFACDACPWLRRCWGEDATPAVRQRHTLDDPTVERLLLDYIEQVAIEGPAKRRKETISALLEDARYGVYGAARYRRARDTEVEDPYAAMEILRSMGREIPTRRRRGRISITLVGEGEKRG